MAGAEKDWCLPSPLWSAASKGLTKEVRQLLAESPDIEKTGGWRDSTPLDEAVCGGHAEIVQLLLEKRADVSTKTNHGTSLLFLSFSHRPSPPLIIGLVPFARLLARPIPERFGLFVLGSARPVNRKMNRVLGPAGTSVYVEAEEEPSGLVLDGCCCPSLKRCATPLQAPPPSTTLLLRATEKWRCSCLSTRRSSTR